MHVELNPVRIFRKYQRRYFADKIRRLATGYNIGGFERIYHFHSRKTAGTSIAKIFLSLNDQDGGRLFEVLAQQADRPLLNDDLIFVGWDKRLIELGQYYFAFSHIPFDDLKLPPKTYRLAVLRDPAERVLSHYRMLLDFSKQAKPHSSFQTEKHWLGNSFSEFLERMPREHLQNQLYMFSSRFDVEQAIERALGLEQIIFFEDLENGLNHLAEFLGRSLPLRHDRRGKSPVEVNENELQLLQELLCEEYAFYDRVKQVVLIEKAPTLH